MTVIKCFLCLEIKKELTKCIKIGSPVWKEQHVESVIEKHLWPMSSMKSQSSWLCLTCWLALSEFNHFYRRIEDVQNYFEDIVKTESHQIQENNDFLQNIDEEIKENFDGVSESDIQYALEETQDNDCTISYSTPSIHSDKQNYQTVTTSTETDAFKCPECKQILRDQDSVSKHIAWHNGSLLSCEICDLIFTERNKLIEHKKIHAPKKENISTLVTFIPEESQTSFISFSCDKNEFMDVGEESIENSFSYECKYCSKLLGSKRQVEKHKAWHEGNVYTCKICYIQFCDVDQYKTHKLLHKRDPTPLNEKVDSEEVEQDLMSAEEESLMAEEDSINTIEDSIVVEAYTISPKEESATDKEDVDHDSNYSVTSVDMGSLKEFKCPYCPNEYIYERSFQTHVEQHEKRRKKKETDKEIKINISLDEYTSTSFDKEDTNTYPSLPSVDMPKQIFECKYCNRELDSERTLYNHTVWHEGIIFQCSECEIQFFDISQFENHQMAHSLAPEVIEQEEEEPVEQEYFMCTFCSRILSSRRLLINHNAWHLGAIYPCDICDMKFMDKCQFDNHTESHMPKTWKRCKECRKPFSCAREVIRHYNKMHRNAFQHVCDVCGMNYRCPLSFKRHVEKHEGKQTPKIPCKICGRLLASKHSLKCHMKINHPEGGVLPYVCHVCLKPMATRAMLKTHIVMQHKTTGFVEKCNVCGKIYKNRNDVRTHSAIHAPEKRHACQWCPEKFLVGNLLSRHRKKAHPVEYAEWKRQQYVQVE